VYICGKRIWNAIISAVKWVALCLIRPLFLRSMVPSHALHTTTTYPYRDCYQICVRLNSYTNIAILFSSDCYDDYTNDEQKPSFFTVVILCVRGTLVRKCMLAAHKLGMTKGEWAFLDVELVQVKTFINHNNINARRWGPAKNTLKI